MKYLPFISRFDKLWLSRMGWHTKQRYIIFESDDWGQSECLQNHHWIKLET